MRYVAGHTSLTSLPAQDGAAGVTTTASSTGTTTYTSTTLGTTASAATTLALDGGHHVVSGQAVTGHAGIQAGTVAAAGTTCAWRALGG